MSSITKEAFKYEWDADWILRSLIIDHYIFWRQGRAVEQNFEKLKKFLSQHSISHSRRELDDILRIYQSRGIFTDPSKPSLETGFINPNSEKIIKDVLLQDYNLDKIIESGYLISDFLWDIYNRHANNEKKMAKYFQKLFVESFGLSGDIFTIGQNTKDETDYLRLSWKEGSNSYSWWLGFIAGNLLKHDDRVAEGLVTQTAFQIKLLSSSSDYSEQFWTLCAIDVGEKSKTTAENINDTFNLDASYNLILVISLIKLLTWKEATRKNKSIDVLNSFSKFFYEGQDCPISASKGIKRIEDSLAKKKN